MFNIGFGELIILGVIGLIFIGPEQLPQVARSIGRLLNEFRRVGEDFKHQFTKVADEGTRQTEALKKEILESPKAGALGEAEKDKPKSSTES